MSWHFPDEHLFFNFWFENVLNHSNCKKSTTNTHLSFAQIHQLLKTLPHWHYLSLYSICNIVFYFWIIWDWFVSISIRIFIVSVIYNSQSIIYIILRWMILWFIIHSQIWTSTNTLSLEYFPPHKRNTSSISSQQLSLVFQSCKSLMDFLPVLILHTNIVTA